MKPHVQAAADQLRAEASTCRSQACHWEALGHTSKAESLERHAAKLEAKAGRLEARQ